MRWKYQLKAAVITIIFSFPFLKTANTYGTFKGNSNPQTECAWGNDLIDHWVALWLAQPFILPNFMRGAPRILWN